MRMIFFVVDDNFHNEEVTSIDIREVEDEETFIGKGELCIIIYLRNQSVEFRKYSGYIVCVSVTYESKFNNAKITDGIFASDIGTNLIFAETDSEDLDKYGINSLVEIQELVERFIEIKEKKF